MSKLIRLAALLLTLGGLGFTQAQAQTRDCPFQLEDLLPPVACAGGDYTVSFDAPCLTTGNFTVEISQAAPPFYNFTPPVASVTGFGSPIIIRIPANLDTSRFYGIRVRHSSGVVSNVKTLIIRAKETSPPPRATIAILRPIKARYCPNDTIVFGITSLSVANSNPPPTFQWQLNGSPVAGADRAIFRYSDWKPGDCVKVLITKGNQCADSATGFSDTICPEIKRKPRATLILNGSGCADSVSRFRLDTGDVGVGGRFQWYLNGVAIAGATGITFDLLPGVAQCRDNLSAKVFTSECPDSVTAGPFRILSCGRVRVENAVPTVACAGDSVRVDYSTVACFEPSNVFTFELSDASGSFAGGVTNLGSVADTNGGVFTGTYPTGLAAGTQYRIRIRSSAPAGISLNTFGPITINPKAPVPTAFDAVRCSAGKVTLRVSSAGATSYRWFTTQEGFGNVRVTRPENGQLVETDTFSIFLTRDTVFYVSAVNSFGCPSETRAAVRATIAAPLVVSAGPDQRACQEGPCLSLLGGSPAGGIYVGTGVNAALGQFCPAGLPIGSYTLVYRYISPIGCIDSATKVITIDSVPAPDAGTPDSAVCKPGPPFRFQLQGFSPGGGVWGGSIAVSRSGEVDPSLLSSLRPDTLTYTITVGGCSRTDTRVLRAVPNPTFTVTVVPTTGCRTATGSVIINPFDNNWTTTYTNSNGVVIATNTGRVDNLRAGVYTVTVRNSTGCETIRDFVISDPTGTRPDISGLASSYCSDDACVPLTALPAGGRWSSNPSGAVDALTGIFCPSQAIPGQPISIFYSFTNPLDSCLAVDTATTIINQAPGVQPEQDTVVCANSGRFFLSAGGTWVGGAGLEGPDANGRYSFNPANAGLVNVLTKTLVANGCTTQVVKSIIVNPIPTVTLTPSGTSSICQGDSVTITASLSAPVAGTVTYIWLRNGGNFITTTSPTITVGQGGTYTVFTTNSLTSCGDTSSQSVTININTIPALNAGPDTVVCANAQPFALRGTPAGGTFRGPGVLNGNQFAASLSGGPGVKTIYYVFTSGACRDSVSRLISVDSAGTARLAIQGTPACGQPTLLSATPAGGNFLYFFFRNDTLLTPGGTTISLFNADRSGNYRVAVFPQGSALSCPDTSDALFIQISNLPDPVQQSPISACQNDNAFPLANRPGGVWTISSNAPANAIVEVSPGNYIFVPRVAGRGVFFLKNTASNGLCTSVDSIRAEVGGTPVFTLITTDASDCFTADGTAKIRPRLDSTRFRIQFINVPPGATGDSLTGLSRGSYTIVVTDLTTGCDSTQLFIIGAPGNFSARINGIQPDYCASQDFVTYSGRPVGGFYTISPSVADDLNDGNIPISILTAGTSYQLIYTVDSAGCQGRDTANFRIKPLPTATIAGPAADTLCQGRTRTLVASTGPGYTYEWFNTGILDPTVTGNTYVATAGGCYQVRVTQDGCSSLSGTVCINFQPAPGAGVTVTGGRPDGCNGDVTTLTATGNGTSFIWLNGGVPIPGATTRTINVSTAGDYRVIVDNGICADTSSIFTINRQPRPAAAFTVTGGPSFCEGDSAILTAASGANVRFVWYFNGTTPADSIANTPTLVVRQSGDYQLRAISLTTGCDSLSGAQNIQFSIRPSDQISILGDSVFCQGNSTILTANEPGATYLWNGPGVTGTTDREVTVTQSGTYTVQVSRGACVVTSGPKTIVVNATPTAIITPAGPLTLCQGSVSTVTAGSNPTLQYIWNLNTSPSDTTEVFTLPTITPSNYTVTVTVVSQDNCRATSLPLNVTVNPTPAAFASPLADTAICPGEAAILVGSPAGGANPSWLLTRPDGSRSTVTPATNPTVLPARERGLYNYILTLNGCSDTSRSIRISIPQFPAIFAGADTQVCISTPFINLAGFSPALDIPRLQFEGPGIVNGTNRFEPATAGTGSKQVFYTLTDSGCTVRDTINIAVVPGFSVTINPSSTTVCAQTPVALTPIINPATPGARYSFQWIRGNDEVPGATDSIFIANDQGIYTVRVTATGTECQSLSFPSQVTYFPFVAVDAGRDTSFCRGQGLVTLVGATPAGGIWSGPGIQPNGNLDTDTAGLGDLTFYYTTNQGACIIRDSIRVSLNGLPTGTATYISRLTGERDCIDILDTVELRATGGNSYQWSPANGVVNPTSATAFASPQQTTTYSVRIIGNGGCSITDTVTVCVRSDVRVANAFSPNEDGDNDYWNIYNIQAYPQATVKVFNRWGALVFESTGYAEPWRGQSQKGGERQPIGTYYYVVDLNNNTKPFVGYVSLVR